MTPPASLALVGHSHIPALAPDQVHTRFCDAATDRELVDELGTLSATMTAATCRLVLMCAEMDRRGIWAQQFAKSAPHWLSWRLGLAPTTAREYVRVGHALPDLPGVLTAFARAEISYSKVRAITRAARGDDGVDWVMLASTMSAGQLERFIRTLGGVEAADEQRALRHRVSVRWDEDGCLVLTARLEPESGAVVMAAIDAMERQLADQHLPVDDASAEASSTGRVQRILTRTTRADALVAVARAATEPRASGSTMAVATAEVVVHVDREHVGTGKGRAWIEGGGALAPSVVSRLSCNPVLTAVVHGRDGRTVDVGRRRRLVTGRLRRTVMQRDDQRCRFPGCEAARFLDVHHVVHWIDGGRTDADNLLVLCGSHHRMLHRDEFVIVAEGSGQFSFRACHGGLISPRERLNLLTSHEFDAANGIPAVTSDGLLPHLDTGVHRQADAITAVAQQRTLSRRRSARSACA